MKKDGRNIGNLSGRHLLHRVLQNLREKHRVSMQNNDELSNDHLPKT